ncbi:diacylglycerol kinase [Patiriisocius hiemis]|uniref:Diacylglycerol kinase family protein n=1 Tax=Patiriisocius hiemis TaxID=3075604 RepID=A0ABU2YA29_9FLAO|nr:diacylglycerol kinase family protein [Constantimarinum sp. W242]MDT0555039.1 diacylglycerol kinase family protein [Constantimarinum sp. W242]
MWNTFLGKRLKGVKYAAKGAWMLIKNEASIQVQTVIAIVMTFAGFYFEINTTEWIFQIIAIALVMSLEGINTAIEEISDFVHPDFHNRIGYIKDVAAGGVFIAALGAVIIGCIIYIPKF